ncbi:MAG: transcriptional regulator [Thermoplasmatota archaeon]
MLNPVIHQETRLQILVVLSRNREASFKELCQTLGLTEGNLGAHADRLMSVGYVEQFHALAGVKFEKRFRLTRKGTDAFAEYRRELARLLSASDSVGAGGGARSTLDPSLDA